MTLKLMPPWAAAGLAVAASILTVAPSRASPYADFNAAAAASPVLVEPVRGGVSVLQGAGGNIGVLVTPHGLFLVDTGIAVSRAKIEAALAQLSSRPLRYAVNTHWHWDHADGNGWVRRTGARIFASARTIDHLRDTIRVAEWEHTFEPAPEPDLPTDPVSGPTMVTLGAEQIHLRPYAGHTDGDLSVYFDGADVLATGDTFWNGSYPFIDSAAGGNIDGLIAQAEENLRLARPQTLIIPGHGPIASRADLEAFRRMLVDVRASVAALKAGGASLEAVQAARPTSAFDARWGGSLIPPALFVALVYRGV